MWTLPLTVLWASLLACGDAPGLPPAAQREALLSALHHLPGDPSGALSLCGSLEDPLRDECVTAVVEAAPELQGLEAWCDSLSGDTARAECWFQLAEGRGDLHACARAAPFVDDCRLHVWTRLLPSLWRDHPPMSEGVARCRAALEERGLDPSDDRYWAAAFRQALARPPLDRHPCETLEPRLATACWNTAVAVLNDRINRVRDFHQVDCTRGIPPELEIVGPDPQLEDLRDARWRAEICPPVRPDPDSESR